MSTKEKEDVVVSNETPNPHAEGAQTRVQELRKWREEIPRFVMPESPDATRRLNSAASVPPEFVELTNVAVANEADLVRGNAATPARVRDLMAYADAYDPLADELEAMAQFVRHSVAVARHEAGTEALTTYALVQRLAKQRKTAHLTQYVADMRRALGKVVRKSSAPEDVAKRLAERAAKAAARAAAKKSKPKTTTTTQ